MLSVVVVSHSRDTRSIATREGPLQSDRYAASDAALRLRARGRRDQQDNDDCDDSEAQGERHLDLPLRAIAPFGLAAANPKRMCANRPHSFRFVQVGLSEKSVLLFLVGQAIEYQIASPKGVVLSRMLSVLRWPSSTCSTRSTAVYPSLLTRMRFWPGSRYWILAGDEPHPTPFTVMRAPSGSVVTMSSVAAFAGVVRELG